MVRRLPAGPSAVILAAMRAAVSWTRCSALLCATSPAVAHRNEIDDAQTGRGAAGV